VRLTFMSASSSVSVGSMEPGLRRPLRMASAVREYTATRRGAPGRADTRWNRNRAGVQVHLCLCYVKVGVLNVAITTQQSSKLRK
jgi:hypothetical protein